MKLSYVSFGPKASVIATQCMSVVRGRPEVAGVGVKPTLLTRDRTSLIKTKFFVGAIGRDPADPPGAPFPDHP
jgi:hypothetical protein